MSLAIAPTTVSNDSKGCPDPAGNSCLATITGWPPTSSLATDPIACTDQSSNILNYAIGWSTTPYPAAQDGPHVYSVTCTDGYTSSSASITLQVVPPGVNPNVDTFAGAYAGNIETLTWQAYGVGACYVEQFSNAGVELTLNPGGTSAGSAASGFLSPSAGPYTFTLYCDGVPDVKVPSITVSP